MILNNIILIIILLFIANYLSQGSMTTILMKYFDMIKNYFTSNKQKEEEPVEKEEELELEIENFEYSASDNYSGTSLQLNTIAYGDAGFS